ncbi:MAG: DUF2442 domain-containing protein [FCB group bacterium]|jgi:hypothetical protein
MQDIIDAKYIDSYKIHLFFEDKTNGIVDFEEYIGKGEVFTNFSNINYFKNFYINKDIGTICWGNNVDISPETLYSKVIKKDLSS